MRKYGLPYKGGKSAHADEILSVLPRAENFYDLFAGGCAMTHCALVSGKYKNIISNDLNDAPQLFLDAVNGKYKNERRWISREEFHAKKSIDPYIRWVWSFGNDGLYYLFGKDIEPIKKAAHEYLFENGYDGTAKKRSELVKKFKATKWGTGRFELQQFERLQQLEQLERLTVFQKDYREIDILSDSVVYCDIPYNHKPRGRRYYGVDFDSSAFFTWADSSEFPVYFSSCEAPENFVCVWSKNYVTRADNKNSQGKKDIVEKLFWNGREVRK